MRKNIPSKVLTFLAVFLVFFTPMIFVTNTKEAFEFPKMFFVYIIGATILATYFIRVLWESKKLARIELPILLYVATYVLSTVFSTHLYTSIWGYYSRFTGGLVSILIFVGIYYVLREEFEGKKRNMLIGSALFSLFPISLYAILQHFTLQDLERVYSTLGQPNWLGAYLIMLFPITLYKTLLADEKTKRNVFAFLTITVFGAIWFTYSVSTLLGLFGSLIYFVWAYRKIIREKKGLVATISIIATFIAITNLGIYGQKLSDIFVDLGKTAITTKTANEAESQIQEIPVQEIETAKQLSDPGFIRIYLWKGTLKLATRDIKTFLVGSGPQTFPYEFQEHRPKELNYSSEWDFILNKPHNYYLEVFAEIGIFGLLSYLYLLVSVFKKIKPQYRAALLGFCITNIFGWPTVATTLLFWLLISTQKENILIAAN